MSWVNPPQRGLARSGHRGCVWGSGERRPRSRQGWVPVLGALSLDVATAAFTPRCSFHAESCEGRCDEGFNSLQKCQCDTLCVYYQSCCSDYSTVCKTKGTGPAAPPLLLPLASGVSGFPTASQATSTGPSLHTPVSAGGWQGWDLALGCCRAGFFRHPAWCHRQCAPPRGWEHPNPVWGHPGLPGTDPSPPAVTRGDVFALPEDDYLDYDLPIDTGTEPPTRPAAPTGAPTQPPTPLPTVSEDEWGTEEPLLETERPVQELPTTSDGVTDEGPEDETEELCSRKPFNAFTDLKNGSLYAFRGTPGALSPARTARLASHLSPPSSPLSAGKYFYELDKSSVRPGYPKLISDVWGIEGPIDAAFTRINCQGKTYLFKVGPQIAVAVPRAPVPGDSTTLC